MHTYIHTSYLHLSDFLQINTSHIQQIITICVNTLLANGILPSILDRKIKWIEAFESRLMATYWVFLYHWYSLFNNLQYSQFLLALFMKFTQQDDRFVEDFCVVYYFHKVHLLFNFKDECITSIIWRQKALLEV